MSFISLAVHPRIEHNSKDTSASVLGSFICAGRCLMSISRFDVQRQGYQLSFVAVCIAKPMRYRTCLRWISISR